MQKEIPKQLMYYFVIMSPLVRCYYVYIFVIYRYVVFCCKDMELEKLYLPKSTILYFNV